MCSKRMFFRHWVLLFLGYKAILFLAAALVLSATGEPLTGSPFAWLSRVDARYVLQVARHGYLSARPLIQVLPAFPLLIRALRLVFRDWDLSAFLAAQVCSAFAFYYFHRLARLSLDEAGATLALVLFAIFPSALYLSVPYTEALFCAAHFAAAYHAQRRQPLATGAAALVAASTRMPGALWLPVALAAGLWSRLRPGDRDRLPDTATLVALGGGAVLGFVGYLALNQSLFGSPFHYVTEQARYFGVTLCWPMQGLGVMLARLPFRISEVVFMFAGLFSLVLILPRRRLLDSFYAISQLLMLACLTPWDSRHRYLLPLYPLFTALAARLGRSRPALVGYGLVSAALLALYGYRFLTWPSPVF